MLALALVLPLLAQTPTPETDAAQTPPPNVADSGAPERQPASQPAVSQRPPRQFAPTARVRRLQRAVVASTQPGAPQLPPPAAITPPPAASNTTQDGASATPTDNALRPAPANMTWALRIQDATDSGPLHYLFYYSPDYASVAGLAAFALGVTIFPPPLARRAAWGPSYDADNGDASAVYAPENRRLLGAPYHEDTVPSWLVPVAGNAALLAAGGLSMTRNPSFRKIHHFVLGAVQAQLTSYLLTELTKSSVGRLRPDYQDRMARYYCATGRGSVPDGVDCTSVNQEAAQAQREGRSTDEVFITRKEFDNGRRSFPSGHASASFVTATYLALFVGGEMVWGESSNGLTRLPGIAAQAAALTAAGFVAASRLSDGRHHPEDVLAGSALGATVGAASYFLHFDLRGRPLVRSVRFSPMATRGGLGMNVSGLLPF